MTNPEQEVRFQAPIVTINPNRSISVEPSRDVPVTAAERQMLTEWGINLSIQPSLLNTNSPQQIIITPEFMMSLVRSNPTLRMAINSFRPPDGEKISSYPLVRSLKTVARDPDFSRISAQLLDNYPAVGYTDGGTSLA